MYRPAIEYVHPEVEIIWYEYDRQDVEFAVGGAGSEKYDLTVCVAHTRLRVDSMMLLRLMLLMMMGPLTIYPPNLEVIRREIVHHSEWLR